MIWHLKQREPADIHPERPPPGFMNIDGFYDDDMQVDGKKYQHSILVMPQFVVKWNATNIEQVTPEHFALATIHYPAISEVIQSVSGHASNEANHEISEICGFPFVHPTDWVLCVSLYSAHIRWMWI